MYILSTLNWTGLVIGAVVAFGVGMAWFSPSVFGKALIKGWGKTQAQMDKNFGGMQFLFPMSVEAAYTLIVSMLIAVLYTLGNPIFCVGVILLMLVQFLCVLSGGLWQAHKIIAPVIVGSFEIVKTLIIILSLYLTATYF